MKVLVTGGSRGIGKSICDFFKLKGHEVISPNRNELDLSDDHINLKEIDFDIIINNAGINPIGLIPDISDQLAMNVNYFSPFKIIQQILPHMIKKNYGRIINIGSIWIDNIKYGRHAYGASKAALHSLTKSIASEYSQNNILANTVSPGFINTDLTSKNNTLQDLEKIKEMIPLKRLGNANEVAELCYFLTIKNTYITAQNILIDGGFTCIRN
jgi:3-oxoacyl-[acyl-carrier protein] reductase